jgi:hypothetical protein
MNEIPKNIVVTMKIDSLRPSKGNIVTGIKVLSVPIHDYHHTCRPVKQRQGDRCQNEYEKKKEEKGRRRLSRAKHRHVKWQRGQAAARARRSPFLDEDLPEARG